MDMLL
jgi:Ca-activated chloride channel family protein